MSPAYRYTRSAGLAGLALLASSCASRAPAPAVCPSLVPYSAAFEAEEANELAGDGPASRQALLDYAGLRAQVHACAGP